MKDTVSLARIADCYQELANEIVLQAVKDYREFFEARLRNPSQSWAGHFVLECEKFFKSNYFGVLTNLDGKLLLKKLQEEIRRKIRKEIQMFGISKETIERIKKTYPIGCKVELTEMDDPQAPPIGTKGIVVGVDDIGSVMVHWDNGSSLSVVYGKDACRKI